MTSQYNKSQIIELGNLFGEDLSNLTNPRGRDYLLQLLNRYQVNKPHAYSASLIQRITQAVEIHQRRQQQLEKQRLKQLKRQRLEQLKIQRKQRFGEQLQLFYEGRINHENLKQFITRDEQDNQDEQRELEEYKQEQREREQQDEIQKQNEDIQLDVLFDPSQEQIDQEWENITTTGNYEPSGTGITKSEKLKEKDNLDQDDNNLEEYFDSIDRQDFDGEVWQKVRRMEENEQQYQQERFQRIHDEFNNIPEIEAKTFKLLDEEIAEDIRKLEYKNFREIDVEDADALLLSEPFNQALFRHEVQKFRQRYSRDQVERSYNKRQSDNFEPTRHYYHNHITSQGDIENHVRSVGTQELQMNHFKIAFDFGFIVEIVTYNEDQVQEVRYDVRYPHNNILNALNPESIIDSQEKLETYIKFLPAKIIENQERTLEDTHTRFVAIVSMVVVAYRDRSGGAAPAELQKFIKRQEVKFVDNLNYRNNCLFDALSFISLPEESLKRISNTGRVAEGKRLMKQFYSAIGNESIKNFGEFLQNYQGFDLASEGKQLANIFNINICVYAYHHLDFESPQDDNQEIKIQPQPKLNSKDNRIHRKKEDRIKEEKYDNYFLDFVIKQETNDSLIKDSPKDFNILLVHFRNKFHILYISDTQALTGLAYCPICKLHAVKVNDFNGNWVRDLKRHIEQCKQNNGKQVMLSGNQIPFAPHITGNKTYEYFWSRQELQKFKPTKYYITYDFETMEEQINKYFGKSIENDNNICKIASQPEGQCLNSFQNSALVPLSVASTIKSKKGIKTIYFDVRSNIYLTIESGEKILKQSFIEQWLEAIFEEALQVKKDNDYGDPEVPYDIAVPVLGFNSAHFDMIFVLPYLTSSKWHITNYLGDFSHIKRVEVRHKITGVRIQFLDAEMFVTKMKLKDFVKDFGDKSNKKSDNKGIFPYTAFNTTNYDEVLKISEPFEQNQFFNELSQQKLSNTDYFDYLLDQMIIIVNNDGKVNDTIKKFNNRWDYLQYYNELDTIIMIKPIDNLIKMNFDNDLDMFNYLSMASCANGTKYKMCCDDLDLKSRYTTKDDPTLKEFNPFELTQEHWNKKVASYNMQDIKAGRQIKDNVKESDFEYFRELIHGGQCWFCEVRFTNKNPPTLDRIDNNLGHSKNNVQLACSWCNVKRGNRDLFITKGLIQLKRYYLAKGLPMPLTDEETYHKLRPNITGGLANSFHRYNVKDETHINKLKLEGQYVVSYDLDYVMTHVTGYDFNSLYPSVMSGIPHDFIKYTGHRIYMPGYELDRIENVSEQQKQLCLKIIDNPLRFSNKQSEIDKVTMFIAEVKGHIDYKYINDYINCPPIIRKYKYKTLESVIGQFMHQHMKNNNLKTDGDENKLTVLLSTMGKYMCFYSYYLWLLIDDCHFIIDDVKCVMTFSKHIGFESFVRKFMQQRIQSKIEGNSGGEQFSKITMNSSYGSDGMNQEHFTDIKLCDIHETFRKHLNGKFKSDRKLGDNLYAVEFEQQKFNCKTCLQVAFAVLDCAKYWFMNFYYNFLTSMIDMNRVHLIYCDTDSMMLAVAGDPKQNYKQGFSAVIKDQKFYDQNFYKFFPKPKQVITQENKPQLSKIVDESQRKLKIKKLQIQDEKKPLGVAYEHCGSTLIALAPKNYWLKQEFDKKDPIVVKLKGMSLKMNPQINKDAYENNIKNGTVVKGKNTSLRQHQERNNDDEIFSKMSRINTTKNGITGVHTKMIVLENQCCCPYIDGITADKYKIQYKMLMPPQNK